MSTFTGDSIALTFTADLTAARAAYDQFIADVSRRPVPVQFQGGGAAAAVGASVANAPGVGGGAQWAVGATGSAAAISGRGIIQGAGVAQPPPLPGVAGGTVNAGTVTINAGTVNIVGGAGGAADAAAAAEGADAPGVGGARQRGGGGGFGFGSNRMIFFAGIAAAASVAHSADAYEDATFQGALATSASQYYGSKAAQWQAIFSGPSGFIGRAGLDALSGTGPLGKAAAFLSPVTALAQAFGGKAIGALSPTQNIQDWEAQAFAARANEIMGGLDSQTSAERIVRMGYDRGYASGGLFGARRGQAEAEIRARGWHERFGIDQHLGELETIQRAERQAGIGPSTEGARGDAYKTREQLMGTMRDRSKASEVQESHDVLRLQREQRQTDTLITNSITGRQAGARLRAQGQFGAAERADLESHLNDFVASTYAQSGPIAGAAAERLAALERAGDTAHVRAGVSIREEATRGIQSRIDRDSLAAQSHDIEARRQESLLTARPEQIEGINDFYDKQFKLAKQRDADENVSARGRLNVENAGLAILANGPGTYAERQTAAAASDIYGQTLLASLAALQGGRPELLGGIKRRGSLQLQSLQQQLLAGFKSEEVNLNKVAVSNPQDDLQKIADIARAVEQIPGKLDEITTALNGIDQVQ